MAPLVILAVEAAATAASIGAGIYEYVSRPKPASAQPLSTAVSSAADGTSIDWGYGRTRPAGQIIWSPGLHYVIQGVGAGGSKNTGSYTYFANFAVAFGQGPATFRRIWGDSQLLYIAPGVSNAMSKIGSFHPYNPATAYQTGDLVLYLSTLPPLPPATVQVPLVYECLIPCTGINPDNGLYWRLATEYPAWDTTILYQPGAIVAFGTGIWACTAPSQGEVPPLTPNHWIPLSGFYSPSGLYPGDNAQLPDPLIQATEGVAATPAFRGLCYAVFNNMHVSSFGNRIPNMRAELEYV